MYKIKIIVLGKAQDAYIYFMLNSKKKKRKIRESRPVFSHNIQVFVRACTMSNLYSDGSTKALGASTERVTQEKRGLAVKCMRFCFVVWLDI